MFKRRLLTTVFAGAIGSVFLPGADPANACTGSANDPPHCINNGQAINGYSNFYFNNLQNPTGCPTGGPCTGSDPFFYGPDVTGLPGGSGGIGNPVPNTPLDGSTGIMITGQNFNDDWFTLPDGTPGCNFGDCSGSPAGTLFGSGPNGGYLCDSGGPGCGSDGFVPQTTQTFFNNPVFNNPYQFNQTSGAVDPFGGGGDFFTDPRTGEVTEFDPLNPPDNIKKALELNRAYVSGAINYPFLEDWEDRPLSDFGIDNPNAIGGVPNLNSNQSVSTPVVVTPGFGQQAPTGLPNLDSHVFNHPYRNNLTSGALDPFGGGEGIFQDPRTGALIEFDPANPPPEIKKAQELNQAYMNGDINYPFYEDWRTRPQSDFDPDQGDAGGVPNPGQLGAVDSNIDGFFAYDPSFGGGIRVFGGSNEPQGVLRDGDESVRPQITLDNGLRFTVRVELEGVTDLNGNRIIGDPDAAGDAYLQNFFAFQPPVNQSPGGGISNNPQNDGGEKNFFETILDNVPDAFKASGNQSGGADRPTPDYQPYRTTGSDITPSERERFRSVLRGDQTPEQAFGTPGPGSTGGGLSVQSQGGNDSISIGLPELPNPSTRIDPGTIRYENEPVRQPGFVTNSVGANPEKVGELAYQNDGQRYIVNVIKTEDGRTLAVGTGEHAGHVFGDAKEGKWGYRREGPWTPPPARPQQPAGGNTGTPATNAASNTAGQSGSDCDNCEIKFEPSRPLGGEYYIHISVANSDLQSMSGRGQQPVSYNIRVIRPVKAPNQ